MRDHRFQELVKLHKGTRISVAVGHMKPEATTALNGILNADGTGHLKCKSLVG